MLIDEDPYNAFVDYPGVPVEANSGGPLAGLTFGVKDLFDVAGYPTGGGNPVKRAESEAGRPQANAPVVDALLAAGASFAGKTHTAELAFSLDGRNEHYGTPINPAARGRVPGGSSSGSASAVSGGLVDFALGSDTGGSVRGPASLCGLIGLRPTHGRIDISRTLPLAPSLDTVGWFARSIDVFEGVGALLLGEDEEGPKLRRLVVAGDAIALLPGAAERAVVDAAISRIAAQLESVDRQKISDDGLAAWAQTFRTVQGFEAWQSHGAWIENRKPRLTAPVAGRFEAASQVSEDEYRKAEDQRAKIRERVREILGSDGVIVLPSTPTIAPRVDADEAEFEAFRALALQMLCTSSLTGFPQISLPLGEVDSCPLGASLIAPPGRDRALIGLARVVLET